MDPRGDTKEKTAHLRDYWRVLWGGRTTILTTFTVIVTVGILATFLQTPVHRASATLEIHARAQKVAPVADVSQIGTTELGWSAEERYFKTQLEVLKSRDVAQRAFEPALPIGVAETRARTGEHQLAGDEEVVRDHIGGEMRQVAQPEGPEAVAPGQVVDLLPHVPRVTVPAHRGVLLGDGAVGRDVAVEEIEREGAQQIGDRAREARQVGQDRLAEVDVGAGGPGQERIGEEQDHQSDGHERGQSATNGQRPRPSLSSRRIRLNQLVPVRNVRRVTAASSAVSSTSSASTSYTASRLVSRCRMLCRSA